ncbi:serine/threonine-protein kinase [Vibrio nigripulchritudo]|uniref:serine/threonine-protein kinase n=1 Tax=Vibrio nigripulchritudo TaxID=28173 RepID=UPI002491EA11|nr:protein kinase [Vibrio nigripulchritudo]BDU37446.1 serine/threonine protein kinase [Vibrio nigripulchritudo]BDU43166.1 serine/threonine protein kinase [Vibrio nigripulchritudo]
MSKDNLPPKEPTKPQDGDRTQIVKIERKTAAPADKPEEKKAEPKKPVSSKEKTKAPGTAKPKPAEEPVKAQSKSPTQPPASVAKKATNPGNVTSNAESLVGTLVKGRYKLESLIGHGGLCDVYRAKDKVLESSGSESPYVALKILQKEYVNQPETARMLIREAQNTQKLSHPNIIRVFDFGVDQQIYYLVMEYLDGETLEQLIQRSRPSGLQYTKALAVLDQILDALHYAHHQDIVHADLKPANIMLNSDGQIKIFDFGVSKTFKLKQDQYAAARKESNDNVGGYTPNYASINLINGSDPKHTDDLFAFACIAYELLSCKHPYGRKPANIALKEGLKAKKPANIPASKWKALNDYLDLSSEPKLDSAEKIKEFLHKNYTPAIAAGVAILGLVGMLGYGYSQMSSEIDTHKTHIAALEQQIDAQNALLDTPFSDVLAMIDAQPTHHAVISQGLLRHHKEAIISEFETRIDEILNDRESSYPNYYSIEKVLEDAKKYYPDSHELETIAADIRSSKLSTLSVLAQRINTHLEKGRYSKSDSKDNVFTLYLDLQTINSDYQFKPSSLANEVFGSKFDTALKEKDTVTLAELITVGNTLFDSVEEHKTLLVQGNKMSSAISALSTYQLAVNSGQSATYPYEAARVLYGEELSALRTTLEGSNTIKELDSLVDNIDNFASKVPSDFRDVAKIRSETANRYLELSDILLNKRKASQARAAMKKANDLLQKVELSKQGG